MANPVRQPSDSAIEVLHILGKSAAPMTAQEIGTELYHHLTSNRTKSGSAAQLAWELIRRDLVARTLTRRELYAYSITDAGRVFLAAPRR